MKREITPEVLDRLIATAEGNITKTKELPGRIWFSRTDRVREMEQTTQALKEFREAMHALKVCHADAQRAVESNDPKACQGAVITIHLTTANALGL